MKNLFNIGISNVRYKGNNALLIKLGGNIIYDKATLYEPYEYRGKENIRKVRTIVNE